MNTVERLPPGAPMGTAAADGASGPEQVTMVIQHHVRPEAVARYEQWLQGIMAAAASFAGHRGVEVKRPHPQGPRRYMVAVRFESMGHAQQWFGSDQRRRLVAQAAELLERAETISALPGLDLWFATPPGQAQPVRWKQFVVTVAAIFPLTVVCPWVLDLLAAAAGFTWLPLLRQAAVAVGVVAAMTWVVMPALTRLLAGWLRR